MVVRNNHLIFVREIKIEIMRKLVLVGILTLGLVSCETETDKRLRENRSKMNDLKLEQQDLHSKHNFENEMYKINRTK